MSVICRSPPVASSAAGADGVASGVADTIAESGPSPPALRPAIWYEYDVPFVNPVFVNVRVVTVAMDVLSTAPVVERNTR